MSGDLCYLVWWLMSSLNLLTCNCGNLRTLASGNVETFFNTTFGSSIKVNKISDWKVLDEIESLSLHCRYITFNLSFNTDELLNQQPLKKWSWKRLDKGKFQTFLNEYQLQKAGSAFTCVRILVDYIERDFNISIISNGTYRDEKKPTCWWTKDIERK